MITHYLTETVSEFLQSRATNTIGRHRIIVYLVHSVLVVTIISMQFLGLGGSSDPLPLSMSGIHLAACLFSLSLYIKQQLTLSKAFSLTVLVAQCVIVTRFFYFATVRPDHFLQLILVNQIASLLAVFFLVISFVRFTPFIVSAISVIGYGCVSAYLQEPSLWCLFGFFFFVQFFLCALGELLRHNVMSVSKENTDLHHRETALMHAVRLNRREIEAYLRMSGNDHPSSEDTDRLFSMLKPTSQRNLVNAVRQYLKSHLMDDCDLAHHFPCLTKSETDVCRLILAGKKRREISMLLGKTENNVDVTRNHIRKKLNVPTDQDLQKFLINLLIEKEYPNTEEINK
ncbi:helix-turn-helix transcriptional regulator [Segatella buccae]|uniref:helix-turn-helix transcriptional regulator n=1 Tax=Segatella buccae TaxID=28126 RepID=UPI0022E8A0F1|nr:LuxR C-terminal-related transcriptional regulator [Segatella buccae]